MAVFGEDADLVVLGVASLSACPTAAVTIFPYHIPADLGCSSASGPGVLVALPAVAAALSRRFPGRAASAATLDLVVVSLLQGNDYLPRLRGASAHIIF